MVHQHGAKRRDEKNRMRRTDYLRRTTDDRWSREKQEQPVNNEYKGSKKLIVLIRLTGFCFTMLFEKTLLNSVAKKMHTIMHEEKI